MNTAGEQVHREGPVTMKRLRNKSLRLTCDCGAIEFVQRWRGLDEILATARRFVSLHKAHTGEPAA